MANFQTLLVKYILSHPNAKEPTYAFPTDAGADLYAANMELAMDYIEYNTGVHVEIPEGYVGLIYPRSSISKTALSLANSVGVIDSNYRGPIKLRFKYTNNLDKIYNIGDRIGQLIIIPFPKIHFQKVEQLNETNRSSGGFGSSGA